MVMSVCASDVTLDLTFQGQWAIIGARVAGAVESSNV